MDAAQVLKLILIASILIQAFALGLRATVADATAQFRAPSKLLKALLAMNVLVPAAAVAVAIVLPLERPVSIALLALSLSPVPPILPGKQLKLGGRMTYVYSLQVAVSLLAIVLVPLGVKLVGMLFLRDLEIGAGEVARLMAMTVLVPLAAGMATRHFAPALAERFAPGLSKLGGLLLLVGLLPVLVKAWPAFVALLGSGTLLATLAVVGVGIAAGHWLGGPEPGDRTALAIAASTRHPGVALAIARLNFPDERLVPAAVLLTMLVAAIATGVYGTLRTRQLASDQEVVPPSPTSGSPH